VRWQLGSYRWISGTVEVGLCDPDAGVGEVAWLSESPPYAAEEIRAPLGTGRPPGAQHGDGGLNRQPPAGVSPGALTWWHSGQI
jgi:hypothetical protein